MEVLCYNELDTKGLQKQYEKVLAMIVRDDFYSAEVKKLTGTDYYRAKLDDTNRLLFKVVTYQQRKYALLLEIIRQHAYEKSRFLNGALVDDSKLEKAVMDKAHFETNTFSAAPYINPQSQTFHILDKIISFDAIQQNIFNLPLPVIIIGSAGSGKTLLTLEKMKCCQGTILYVTGSPYLVQNAQQLYYAHGYNNDAQEIEFLSYRELLETIYLPEGKEMDFPTFSAWLTRTNRDKLFQDAHTLYEEFKGVITGNTLDKPYLSQQDYINLGIKQSIYALEERAGVYVLFEKYRTYLKEHHYYDINLLSFDYLASCTAKYDAIVIDEVQDFTPIQLSLILHTLNHPQQFILCGDSNQIVHPNFFSWAKIKSLFYQHPLPDASQLIRVLNNNYRNAPAITELANQILRIKTRRFGSIDKESHYLVESQSTVDGKVYCLLNEEGIRQEINGKTAQSTHFAIIVLHDKDKIAAAQHFQTPLIFSVHEAKGLEYENVILFNLITSEEKKFREIAQGVNPKDLQGELVYARVKDKSDRSLEIYKFYINAWYVALTRAVKQVYVIEEREHPLLDLVGLKPSSTFVPLEKQQSSLDDWQKEMRRLEQQGKQAQADAIRQQVLRASTVPWHIITPEALTTLCHTALNRDKKDKEARLLLFEYALVYWQPKLFTRLAHVNFAPAHRPKNGYELLERKYFMGYTSSNTVAVMRHVSSYGVDFRNIFNQTPLMVASRFGNSNLVKELIEKGANRLLTDNGGRDAFQIALQQALLSQAFSKNKLAALYAHLLPDSISLLIDNNLVKLNSHHMEFFLLNAMIAIANQQKDDSHESHIFRVDDFLAPLQHFHPSIMPERRKKRAYISSILAKNEISREHAYNRKLFYRIARGYYILNPQMAIKIENEWVNIYQLLNLEEVVKKRETQLKATTETRQ